jgi:alkylhydroperoxidase family enzyme
VRIVWTCTGRICESPASPSSDSIGLDAWQECPYYSERERAALAWTEAVTLVADGRVSDAVYATARAQFSERELSDLTLTVATINAWNRLSIAGRLTPGTYQPAKTGA